ncbi:hypothetical protein F4803DRAFT_22336 [Xylaria telfairii]|nr:hypothetical protein F4803DRAFT_22336 [Xylaria telfairii]
MASEQGTQEAATPKIAIPEVANFLSLLSTLVSDPSATWINKVLKDNDDMKAAVKQKEAEYNGFIKTIAKVSRDFEAEVEKSKQAVAQSDEAKTKASELATEVEDAKKTIADKDQKLQENTTTITNLQENVESLDKQVKARDEVIKGQGEKQANDGACIKALENELGMTKDKLDATSNQLKELRDLSCEVTDESKEFVLNEINKIYGYAKTLATKYFGDEDLSEEVLSDTFLFEKIRKFVKIPFPSSNSPAAKKARVAAFLACLGSRLADLIFLPYYTEPNDDEEEHRHGIDAITALLSNLSHSDPMRELHLRSVLLAISPDEQTKRGLERADSIANDMYNILGVLLEEDQRVEFDRDVTKLCQLAVESWDTLRPLKEKVEPFTMSEEDNEKYWLPAELDSVSQSKKQASGKPNGLGSKPSLQSLKSANKVVLVWPGFSYGSEVLKQGFMLLESQVRSADEEQPLKRERRAMQRALTSSPVLGRHSTHRKSKILNRKE